MKDFSYVTKNEIAVKHYGDAMNLMETLLDNDYVVMISREEQLYIVNYIWGGMDQADRNNVCFQARDMVEDFIFNPEEED